MSAERKKSGKKSKEQFTKLPFALEEAISTISALVSGDQLSDALGKPVSSRDARWAARASEYPAYQQKIMGLRQALVKVADARQVFPSETQLAVTIAFYGVQDRSARNFLTDMFFSRLLETTVKIDGRIDPGVEAATMLSEMGMPQDFHS